MGVGTIWSSTVPTRPHWRGFHSELLGLPITYRSDDWVVIADMISGFAPNHQPPRWPDPNRPQQVHLDVMVDDLDVAASQFRRWVRGDWRRAAMSTPTLSATPSA